MPFIRVDWFPGRTLKQKRELAEVLTREFARIAKCKPETINFIFTEVSREDWGRSGKLFVTPMNMRMIPISRQLVPSL
jgi:4-oxalocrotonate tautomerase